jgi:hypothetical protein
VSYWPIDANAFYYLCTEGAGYSQADKVVLRGVNANFWSASKCYAAARRAVQSGKGATAEVEFLFDLGKGNVFYRVTHKAAELFAIENDRCGIRIGQISAANGLSRTRLWQRLGWEGSDASPVEATQRQDALAAFAATANRRCHLWSAARQVGMGGFLFMVLALGLKLVPANLARVMIVVGFGTLYGCARYQHTQWAHHAGFTWAASITLGGTCKISEGQEVSNPVSQALRDPTDLWGQTIGDGYLPADFCADGFAWTFARRVSEVN